MINQDKKDLPKHYAILADDFSNKLMNKISNEVIIVIQSVDNEVINNVFNGINMREDEKNFSFMMTILISVVSKALKSIKNPNGTREELINTYDSLLKHFIDGVWRNLTENDSAVH